MFFLFFALWVIFNGAVTLEICLFGIIIAAVMFAFICRFMDYSVTKEKMVLGHVFWMLRYICVLIREIAKANFTVVGMILSEKEELEPALVQFDVDLETSVGKALLANAITLTPGTITVMLDDSGYVVHCLDESLAEGMDRSVFVDRLKDMEQQNRRH